MRRGCLGTRPKRRLALRVSLLCAVTVVLALPGRALAHVEVVPTDSPAGVTERYAIRIPTEKPVPTVRLEIEFPSGLRVADIEASPGWQVSVQTDSSGRPIGAVWEGGSIPAGQFAELRLTAQNPEGEAQLRWSVIQTYSDATEVQWIGPPNAEFPAATTRVRGRQLIDAVDARTGAGVLLAVGAVLIGGLAWRASRSRRLGA